MRSLPLVLLAAAGRGRAALVVACTAVGTGLLLVAVSILRLPGLAGDYRVSVPGESLIGPIEDPGTRGGAVFGIVLLVMPVLLLLDQAVRLGSSARRRRYAALAVAGATRADLRRWGVVEVGLPATVGALLGVPLWLLLRYLLGVVPVTAGRGGLVPTTVGPGWWALLVLAAVAAYGAWVGLRSGARSGAVLARSRGIRRPPRPWGLLVLGLGAVVISTLGVAGSLGLMAGLALLVVGLAMLSPWVAHRVALVLVRRASSAELLLATRRLAADPGPAGRAAAAVGAVALAGGVIGPLIGKVLEERDSDAAFFVGPALLAAGLAAIAALVVAGTLAVHSTETVLERRREMAALVATGVPVSVVARSQRLEIWVATLPLATVVCVVFSGGYWALGGAGSVLWPVLSIVVTLAVIAGAGALAATLVRPWLRDAVRPANLRTE